MRSSITLVTIALSLALAAGCLPTANKNNPAAEVPAPTSGASAVATPSASYTALKEMSFFCVYPTAGKLSKPPQIIGDFQSVLREPQADARFKELLTVENTTAQMFGLCGVYFTDPATFAKECKARATSQAEVMVITGDVIRPLTMAQVIGPGASVELQSDGTLKLPPVDNDDDTHPQIATGQVPEMLRSSMK